jgi:hypothetical protein
LSIDVESNAYANALFQIDVTEFGITNSQEILLFWNALDEIEVTHSDIFNFCIFELINASFHIVLTVLGISISNGCLLYLRK